MRIVLGCVVPERWGWRWRPEYQGARPEKLALIL